MPEAVPVTNECEECDLCCVLASTTDEGCSKLFWQCKCPGGALTMQQEVAGVWGAISGWSPSGTGFWYPPAMFGPSGSVSNTTAYRLKCTLASGEVYYSNEVTPSVGSALCKCWDGSAVNNLYLEVNYTYTPYTVSGGVTTWGTPVSKTVTLGCTSGQTSATMEVDLFRTLDVVFLPEASRYFVEFRLYNTIGGGGLSTQTLTKDYSSIGVSHKCYPSCGDVAPSWFVRIGAEYTWDLCYATSGGSCIDGAEVKVDSVGLLPI